MPQKKLKVYCETSFWSYLTGRPSAVQKTAYWQSLTRIWWSWNEAQRGRPDVGGSLRDAAENIRALRERSETLYGWYSRNSASRKRSRLVVSRLLPVVHRKRFVSTDVMNRFDKQLAVGRWLSANKRPKRRK